MDLAREVTRQLSALVDPWLGPPWMVLPLDEKWMDAACLSSIQCAKTPMNLELRASSRSPESPEV